MTNAQRDIQRTMQVLQYADTIDYVSIACRYFVVGRPNAISGRAPFYSKANLGW